MDDLLAEFKKYFTYKAGNLYWLETSSNRRRKGEIAGSKHSQGYWAIMLKGKMYYAHRIIFAMHHGYFPDFIDHIDQNRANNKIRNLRAATNSENGQNKRPTKNSSKFKGVFWSVQKNRWAAHIKKDGVVTHLGFFHTEPEAAKAYNRSAKKMFGRFASLNKVT